MIQDILNYFSRCRRAAKALSERDTILRDVRAARRQLNAAQAKYDALMDSIVWTPKQDRRVELAFKELKLADERYGLMIACARSAGVMSGWDAYEEEMVG